MKTWKEPTIERISMGMVARVDGLCLSALYVINGKTKVQTFVPAFSVLESFPPEEILAEERRQIEAYLPKKPTDPRVLVRRRDRKHGVSPKAKH